MRISKEIQNFFKQSVKSIDATANVYLFGSRTDDNKKGGDIDILILSNEKIDLDKILLLKINFYKQFGEQKLDIINFTYNENNSFKDYILDSAILL